MVQRRECIAYTCHEFGTAHNNKGLKENSFVFFFFLSSFYFHVAGSPLYHAWTSREGCMQLLEHQAPKFLMGDRREGGLMVSSPEEKDWRDVSY